MNRVERHIIRNDKELNYLCWLSKNLYNYTNYCLRQSFSHTGKLPSEYELTKKFAKREQADYKALPAQTSQQVIKLLYNNWKSFFKAVKDYKKNPKKYKGRPKLPSYKDKDGQNIVLFTGQQCHVKEGIIKFPKNVYKPLRTKVDNVVQVRIVPQATCYIIEVVYEKEGKIYGNLKKEKLLAIDLGVNNLATCVNNVGKKPFIINGKPLKSINQYSNKLKAKYMSYIGGKGTSKRTQSVLFKRNNLIQNYLHHASKLIINYCVDNDIGTIIIGHNSGWKQEVETGKVNNQNFVSIPFNTLIQQIQYKGEEVGITVILTEESYSSKVDHLAFETMEHHENYLGKRVKRGLFKSSTGKYLNADVNGAIGIARKVTGDTVIRQLISRGQALCPVRLNTGNLTKVSNML